MAHGCGRLFVLGRRPVPWWRQDLELVAASCEVPYWQEADHPFEPRTRLAGEVEVEVVLALAVKRDLEERAQAAGCSS